MPPDQLEKIFDKFSQASRDDRFRGTGLGLTISRYIVEAHHGKIWAESELEKGSKFIFQIPFGLVANEKGK
jgi:signal transduction histidine kinase